MSKKLGMTQSTLMSPVKSSRYTPFEVKDGQSVLKNPFNQTLPIKFPKNHIIKQCSQSMLDQTAQNPHVSSIRNYGYHNTSRFFEGSPYPLSQSQLIAQHPQHRYEGYPQRKLASPGVFGHLSRESMEMPVKLRTYEDIGTNNNSRRCFSKMHYQADPIITPVEHKQYNSTLDRTWKEARRHRDNGVECQKVLVNNGKPKKRQPYNKVTPKTNTTNSYKQMYLISKAQVK